MKRKDAWLILILVLAVIVFFSRMIFDQQAYFLGDIMSYFQPWTVFGAEGIQNGHFYLWNPYLCNGEPFLANIQAAVFYPLKIFFYLFPFVWAFKAYLLVHFSLAGLFLFLLLKQYKYDTWACFLGALVFTFSGFMLVQIEFFSVLASLLWFSLAWVVLEKALSSRGIFYWVICSLVLALQFYGGYTFLFYYTNLLIILYVAWRRKFNCWRQLLLLWSLVVGLAAVQLLPTVELMQYGIRSAWTFKDATTWSLPPLFLLKFIFPDLVGKACLPGLFPQPFGYDYFAIKQYWLSTFYLGIAPLLFLFFSWRGRKTDYFWEMVALISLFLSMSADFPLTRYYYQYMPLAKNFTHPASFMFFFIFSLIIFITRGLDNFLHPSFRVNRKAVMAWLSLATGAYVVIYLIFYQRDWLQHLAQLLVGMDLRNSQCIHLEVNFFEFSMRLFAALGLVYWWYRQRGNSKIKYLVMGFMLLDLFSFGWNINPLAPNNFFSVKPDNVETVRAHLNGGRFMLDPEAQMNRLLIGEEFVEKYQSLRQALQPNAGLPYHLPYNYEYGYFTIKEYKDLLLQAKSSPSIMDSSIMDMLGGRLILSYKKLTHDKLALGKYNYIGIYENKAALPRAWLVHKAKFLPREKTLEYLGGRDFKPGEELVLSSPAIPGETAVGSRQDSAQVTENDPDDIIISGQAAAAGYLVLSDVYYPGWRAAVNGQAAEILKANYIIKAISLKAGPYQASLRYRPFGFYFGLILTLFTLLGANILLLKGSRRELF